MKKLLLVLGMITCMFGMTACGSTVEEVNNYGVTEEDAQFYADNLINQMNQIVVAGQTDAYASEAVIAAGLESYETALADMGDYQDILSHEVVYGKGIIINVGIRGTLREATVEIILDEELALTSLTTNVKYSFGELMENAALNTLLGMGTVFAVLILISFLISCFKLLSKVDGSGKKNETVAKSADKAITQIIEQEEAADDTELIAVIAAAIAASEGAASTDGYVVRSIKRRR